MGGNSDCAGAFFEAMKVHLTVKDRKRRMRCKPRHSA